VGSTPGRDPGRLAAAVKADDGFFTTYFVSPYSKYVARWCAEHGVTPNVVTTASMLMGAVAAACFAVGKRPDLVTGAVLLQLSFTLDCVDGQLARYTGASSAFGGWLDAVFDRSKEYLVYAGLAIGSIRGFDDDVWALAAAALVLQAMRHLTDFSFHARPSAASPEAGGNVAGRLSALSARRSWSRWPKRILVLPIGERFVLISVTAAVWRPEVTFVALLVWGGVAAAYGISGRLARSFA
jgi:hypothetical protein